MSDPFHPLHSSLVRIHDGQGTIVGVGFLAAPQFICTCAHVVADALHIPRETDHPPEQEVRLDFPFLERAEGTACIHVWVCVEPDDGGGDIAILRLMTDQPAAARPARMLPMNTFSGKAFAAYGFPSATDVGQYAYGILRDRIANGYVQLEGTTSQGYRIQQGYSGTPVWDQRGRGVVGMVVAEDRAPDAKVAYLIPNDLILRSCPEIKPVTFKQLFAQLTDGLMGLPGSPLDGVEHFLYNYLGIPDEPAPFGGRQEQLDELNRWLTTPAQPYALLVEEAGRGKSALLAQWVATVVDEQRADVAFVPISLRFGTSLKSTTVCILGARLRHLHRVRADLPRDLEGWLAEIDMYLREDRLARSPLLIVLDGADEAADWIMGQDLRFPPEPGNGVKVLVSARPLANCDVQVWLRRLEWQRIGKRMELPLLNRMHVAEVLQSMGNPLARLGTQVDVVSELHRLSAGDPLLIRLYVEALGATGEQVAFLATEDLRRLTPGLQSYFDRWWHDQQRHWGTAAPLKEQTVRSLLALMACALGPLSIDDLLSLMEPECIDSLMLEDALQPLARFVVGDGKGQGYVFSHPRLNQYFYEKLAQRERQDWEKRFLDYGRQTLAVLNNGERHPAEVSSYPVRYYGVHLERGGAHLDRFDELASEGWQRAWVALEGVYNGFLNDVMRAWKLADEVVAQAQSTQERSRAIGCQCRYALIVTSINSLVGNIPPALLAALVDKGIWTPAQGVASVRQILSESQRAEALAELAPYLSASLLHDALEAARAITYEESRAKALMGLAPYVSESLKTTVLREALEAARAITHEMDRTKALTELAPYLSAPLLHEALEAARAITHEMDRTKALVGLAPHLAEPQRATVLREALEAARAIMHAGYRAGALADLAPHLMEPQRATVLREALEAARADKDMWGLMGRLKLVRCLGKLGYGEEALEIARAIKQEDLWADALVGLVPHLSVSQLQEVLEAAQTMREGLCRVRVLIRLAPYLGESLQTILLQEMSDVARAMRSTVYSSTMFVELVQGLWELGYREKALEVARAITHKDIQIDAFISLALYLSAPLLQEVLETIRAMRDEKSRVKGLVALASYLKGSLQATVLQEALETTQAVRDEESQIMALVGLAPYLPVPLIREVLDAVRAVSDERSRAKALATLVPHLSMPLVQEALEAARAMNDEGGWVWPLESLAQRLGVLGYGEEAMEVARAITHEESRVWALVRLVSYLAEPLQAMAWQEALAAARAIYDEEKRAKVLAKLAPYLAESLRATMWQEALAAARAITPEWLRGEVLMMLVPYLERPLQTMVWREVLDLAPVVDVEWRQAGMQASGVQGLGELGYGEEALATARAISDEWRRAEVLMRLAPHLAEPLQATVRQEALAAARVMRYEEKRAEIMQSLNPLDAVVENVQAQHDVESRVMTFVGLAPHISISLLQEALEAALTVSDEQRRTRVLECLLPHLSAPLLQEVLEAARAMLDGKNQGEVLVSLVQRLVELGYSEEALEVARTMTHEWSRATALACLAPHLTEPLLQEALETARTMRYEVNRATVLTSLAPHLAESVQATVWQEALAAVRVMRDDKERVENMKNLVPQLMQLSMDRLYALWCETLRILATSTRSSLLSDIQILAPLMAALGEEAPVATMQAINEIGKRFP